MASSGNQFKLWAARAVSSLPSLSALTLQSSTAAAGVSGSTNILGRTAGSTLTLTDTVGGIFSINSTTAVLSWSSGLTSGSNTPTIRETLAGSSNSPRDSSPTLTGTSGLVINDPAPNGSPYTSYPPTYRDAFLVMAPVVDQGDEAVDVQAVVGTPYSPVATKVTFSGSDVQWFDASAGGKLIFKAATRASVPRNQYLVLSCVAENANGLSEACTVWIWVPADADCKFVSPDGNDVTGTGTKTAPWKHCPRTSDFTGTPPAAFTNGECIIFEGVNAANKRHETALVNAGYPFFDTPPHHGQSINSPVRYCFYSWRGQAKFSGALAMTNAWVAALTADVYGNPNLANCTKTTMSTAIERYQMVCWGDVMGRMAQYPRPNNLKKNEDPIRAAANTNNYNDTAGTSDGGFKRIFITGNASDATPVRMWISADGSNSYIQDAKLDARFNNVSVAYNAAGTGMWIKIWGGGNNVYYVNVLSYDLTTHRMTFSVGAGAAGIGSSYPTNSGYSAYALLNSPYDVQVESQYALTPDGLGVVAYRPASPGQAYVSRLHYGMNFGQQPNIALHQAWFERYSGGQDSRAGNSPTTKGGSALYAYYSGGYAGNYIYGLRVHQMNSEDEDAIGLYAYNGGGFVDPIFDRFHFSDTIRGGGSKCVSGILGKTTGSGPGGFPTKAEILAYTYGKVRWWFAEEDSLTRTFRFWFNIRGLEFRESVIRRHDTVHGDGDAWYRDSDSNSSTVPYADHLVMVREFGDSVLRWKTTSDGDPQVDSTVGRYCWYDQCVVLGSINVNAGITLYSGDPGGLYNQCIFMLSPDGNATGETTPCFDMRQGLVNMTIQNSILNGISYQTSPYVAVPATWSLLNNGLAAGSFPADDVVNNRRQTGTTALTPPTHFWDATTIPTAWQTILRAGAGSVPIGPFWKA